LTFSDSILWLIYDMIMNDSHMFLDFTIMCACFE